VASRDILRIRLDGRSVYQLQTFSLKAGGLFVKATEATTACTQVGIITGSPDVFGSDRDAADDQRDMIQKVREVPGRKATAAGRPRRGDLEAGPEHDAAGHR
jgi:hypothetical protein